MTDKKNILAICGSTRQHSTNLNLIKAIAALYSKELKVNLFDGLSGLPHFNPDTDNENPPAEIVSLRRQIREADGIIICTPEYAMGLPGSLKNLLDWTVSSSDFSDKPVLAITASTSGQKAHQSLVGTLQVIEARMTEATQLLISFAKTKVNNQHEITHEQTSKEIDKAIISFSGLLNSKKFL